MSDEAPIDQGNPWDKVREISQRLETKDREIERLKAELARIRGLPRLATLDAEIERLKAALQRIADMCPATAELTLAHEMADNAMAALERKP